MLSQSHTCDDEAAGRTGVLGLRLRKLEGVMQDREWKSLVWQVKVETWRWRVGWTAGFFFWLNACLQMLEWHPVPALECMMLAAVFVVIALLRAPLHKFNDEEIPK